MQKILTDIIIAEKALTETFRFYALARKSFPLFCMILTVLRVILPRPYAQILEHIVEFLRRSFSINYDGSTCQ